MPCFRLSFRHLMLAILLTTTATTLSRPFIKNAAAAENAKASPSFPLYLQELASEGLADSGLHFVPELLPPEYQLPSAGPTVYGNQYLIWAVDKKGQKILGFRPIDTTTGCKSGCTPVVFHLVLATNGQTIKILEEETSPLRKIFHRVLTTEDKEKLLKIAQNLPDALKWIENPEQLTNSFTHFPPQTWSIFSDSLVKGGAYTSYRVFQAALTSWQYLALDAHEHQTNLEDAQTAQTLLEAPISDLAELRLRIAEINSALQNPHLDTNAKNLLIPGLFKFLKELVQKGVPSTDFAFVRQGLPKNELLAKYRYQYCDFLTSLLKFKNGQTLLIEKFKHANAWPVCEAEMDQMLPLMAATLLEDKAQVQAIAKAYQLEDLSLSPFVQKEAFYLDIFYHTSLLLGKENTALEALADLTIRYPFSTSKKLVVQLTPKQLELFTPLLEKSKAKYKMELARAVNADKPPFPEITGFDGQQKPVALPIVQQQKQIYVFIAPWCPHCRKAVSNWAKDPNLTDAFWSKLVFISVFAKQTGRAPLQEFCQITELDKYHPNLCSQIVLLQDPKLAKEFYSKINLTGVPRIMLTTTEGKIGVFDYELPSQRESDFQRDLLLLLEMIK
jgi:thiol-disulfide isomerase/thioredoxin